MLTLDQNEKKTFKSDIPRKEDMNEVLLQSLVDPNTADEFGKTRFHQLVESGDVPGARGLYDMHPGVLSDITTKAGETPLMLARSAKMMKFLLEECIVEINAVSKCGKTALQYAVDRKDKESVELLLSKGADPNLCKNEESPIYRAVETKDCDIVKMLLEQGANPDTHPVQGNPPLLTATLNKDRHITKLLLEYKANPDACNVNGQTALMFEARRKNTEGVVRLLEYDAQPDISDKEGWSALHFAIASEGVLAVGHNTKQQEATEALMLKFAERDEATLRRRGQQWNDLYEIDAISENIRKLYSNNDLERVGEQKIISCVAPLLEAGANPNKASLKEKICPLHLTDNGVVAKALINAGANPVAETSFGITPIQRVNGLPSELRSPLARLIQRCVGSERLSDLLAKPLWGGSKIRMDYHRHRSLLENGPRL